jgi:hypothetical protein
MEYLIIGPYRNVETIATGHGIRELARLKEEYGSGRWRKRKGDATLVVRGDVFEGEFHWYEAHGIGKREIRLMRTWKR